MVHPRSLGKIFRKVRYWWEKYQWWLARRANP